jgi:hypothetical protein
MPSKHPDFTYSYHFLSQAIIVFLLVMPFLHFLFEWVPYWSYLGVATVTAAVFFLYSRLEFAYGWYLASAPVIFGVFLLLGYPLVLSALFSALLVWRFIKIRKDEIMHQENAYVLYTLFLTTAMFVIVRDTELFLLLGIQILILLFGYLLSHLLATSNKEENRSHVMFWLLIAGILAAVTMAVIPLLNFGRMVIVQLWQGFINLVVWAISQLAAVFPDTELFSSAGREVERLQMGLPEEGSAEQVEPVYADAATPDFLIWLFILAGVVVLYFVLRIFKRRFTVSPIAGSSDVVSYSKMYEEEKESFVKRLFRRTRKKPDHPIRRLVFDFELLAGQHKKGRKNHETVEEWLQRTGLNVDMAVYQKVRYGHKDVTESESNELTNQLETAVQMMSEAR